MLYKGAQGLSYYASLAQLSILVQPPAVYLPASISKNYISGIHIFKNMARATSMQLTTIRSVLLSLMVAQQPRIPVNMTTAPAAMRMYAA